jgi:AhpD family alkylhydroperoxidase
MASARIDLTRQGNALWPVSERARAWKDTMDKTLTEFQAERQAANERILSGDDRVIKRFFRLDDEAYEDGALPAKTKELLGLVASMVLRCDDCISYHVIQCIKCGVTVAEFEEAFAIALVVGGSIVIPHLRRAYARMDEVGAKHSYTRLP